MSLVIKVYVHFDDETKAPFSVVLKVPMADAINKMISNGEKVEEETKVRIYFGKLPKLLSKLFRTDLMKTRRQLLMAIIANASFMKILEKLFTITQCPTFTTRNNLSKTPIKLA